MVGWVEGSDGTQQPGPRNPWNLWGVAVVIFDPTVAVCDSGLIVATSGYVCASLRVPENEYTNEVIIFNEMVSINMYIT